MRSYFIHNSGFQAHVGWCWAEHMRGWLMWHLTDILWAGRFSFPFLSSHQYRQQSFLGLHSPGRSNHTKIIVWGDEDMTFNIPWAWCIPVDCELNSFLHIHQSQISIHFHEDYCLLYSWDRWIDQICLRHKSLLHSSRCFPFQIF